MYNYKLSLSSLCSTNNKVIRDFDGNEENFKGNITADINSGHDDHFHLEFDLENIGDESQGLRDVFDEENGKVYLSSVQYFRDLKLPEQLVSQKEVKVELLRYDNQSDKLVSSNSDIAQDIFVFFQDQDGKIAKVTKLSDLETADYGQAIADEEEDSGLSFSKLKLLGHDKSTGECKESQFDFNPFVEVDLDLPQRIPFFLNSKASEDIPRKGLFYAPTFDRDLALSVEYFEQNPFLNDSFVMNSDFRRNMNLDVVNNHNGLLKSAIYNGGIGIDTPFFDSTGKALIELSENTPSHFYTRRIVYKNNYSEKSNYFEIFSDKIEVLGTEINLRLSGSWVTWAGQINQTANTQVHLDNHDFKPGFTDEYLEFDFINLDSKYERVIKPRGFSVPGAPTWTNFSEGNSLACGFEWRNDGEGSYVFMTRPFPTHKGVMSYIDSAYIYDSVLRSSRELDFKYDFNESKVILNQLDCVTPWEATYGSTVSY